MQRIEVKAMSTRQMPHGWAATGLGNTYTCTVVFMQIHNWGGIRIIWGYNMQERLRGQCLFADTRPETHQLCFW